MTSSDQRLLADRYRVLERLGSGGMASVLLAEDENLGRLVAIKRLPTSSPDEALTRFRREARLGASLNHPNVVSIFDSTIDEDALLIVMEYVKGRSLKDLLGDGPLEPQRALAVLGQIAAALDHAHASGVIHRDVKPANVLIADDGTAKLADLGIATAVDATSITTTNAVIGTLSYIAPERLEGAENDASADVYALAAVAFEMLSGRKAQRAQTPAELVNASAAPDLRAAWPGATPAAAEVLRTGMDRDPSRRPASAGELVERLGRAMHAAPQTEPLAPEATATLPLQRDREPQAAAPAAARSPRPAAAASPRTAAPTHAPHRRRGRRAALAGVAAAAGVALAIVLISAESGSDGDGGGSGKTSAEAPPESKASPEKVTTTNEPEPVEVALTGAALGRSLNDQGFDLITAGDYESAASVLQEAVDAFPDGSTDINYAYALYNLGHALRLAGRPEEAVPVLEERLQYPNQTETVENELALAQQEAGIVPEGSGDVEPDDEGSSGGVGPSEEKPGKGPKPKKDTGEGDD